MTMTDPIADMLTRIRNANTAKHVFLYGTHCQYTASQMCIRDSSNENQTAA